MLAMQCSYEIAMQYMRWRDYVSEQCLTVMLLRARAVRKLAARAELAQQDTSFARKPG